MKCTYHFWENVQNNSSEKITFKRRLIAISLRPAFCSTGFLLIHIRNNFPVLQIGGLKTNLILSQSPLWQSRRNTLPRIYSNRNECRRTRENALNKALKVQDNIYCGITRTLILEYQALFCNRLKFLLMITLMPSDIKESPRETN